MRMEASYLVRIWKDGKDRSLWRVSLKDLRSQELLHFKDLKAFYAFFDGYVESIALYEEHLESAQDE